MTLALALFFRFVWIQKFAELAAWAGFAVLQLAPYLLMGLPGLVGNDGMYHSKVSERIACITARWVGGGHAGHCNCYGVGKAVTCSMSCNYLS